MIGLRKITRPIRLAPDKMKVELKVIIKCTPVPTRITIRIHLPKTVSNGIT